MYLTLAVIVALTVLGGVMGAGGAAFVLYFLRQRGAAFTKHFVSLAAGTIFAAVFFEMLPEAIEASESTTKVMGYALLGLVAFYLTERIFLWTHHHDDEDAAREHSHKVTIKMIMLGDTVHNFVDGIAIGAATLVSPIGGLLTALAVFTHEVPQEMGDMGTMMHLGYPRKKAIAFNLVSSLASVIGGVSVYLFGLFHETHISSVLAFIAGGFIYIAGADLLPEAHRELNKKREVLTHVLTFLFGITVVYILGIFLHE